MDKMAEKEEVTAETSTEDAEKVVVEPYDAADIDFDTFCKSDMRVVKVKDCVAVKKSKKLLQFTLDDGSYEYKGADAAGIVCMLERQRNFGRSGNRPRKTWRMESFL